MDAIHKVSDPSTDTSEGEGYKPLDRNFLGWLRYAHELPWVRQWMLSPADGAYCFLDFDDLSCNDMETMVSRWLFDQVKAESPPFLGQDRVVTMDTLSKAKAYETSRTAQDLAGKIENALAAAIRHRLNRKRMEAEHGPPVPARPGHLVASEREVERANRMPVQNRFPFDAPEPFNAYTMLYGKKIARGGDMITGCAVTDGVAKEYKDYQGKTQVRYEGYGVNF